MGAWIETNICQKVIIGMRSLPSWERGLKRNQRREEAQVDVVAPLVGAWIETMISARSLRQWRVAPLVGAWIETDTSSCRLAPQCHRLSCCGADLKSLS